MVIRLRNLLVETDTKKDTPYVSGDTYISKEEAKRVYDYMQYDFDFNQFVLGMNVELEHQDVTDGSLIKTAMIAAAHLREVPDYYTKLKQHVEPKKMKKEDGAPTGGIGLNLPGGYINAAPKPQDVKKMRKHLNKEKQQ